VKKALLVAALLGMNATCLCEIKSEVVKTHKVEIKNSNKNGITVEIVKKKWDKSTLSSFQNVPSKKRASVELTKDVIEVKIALDTEKPMNYTVEVK